MAKMNLTGAGGPSRSAPSEQRSVISGSATAFLPPGYWGAEGDATPGDADDQTGAVGRLGRGAEPAADDRGKQAMRGSLESEGGMGGTGKVTVRRASGDSSKTQSILRTLRGE
jgi:hypothetical protein